MVMLRFRVCLCLCVCLFLHSDDFLLPSFLPSVRNNVLTLLTIMSHAAKIHAETIYGHNEHTNTGAECTLCICGQEILTIQQ